MKILIDPDKSSWKSICKRPSLENTGIFDSVREILEEVKKNGDAALKKYTIEFDKVDYKGPIVTKEELEYSEKYISEDLKAAIKLASNNIKVFHESQREKSHVIETTPGVRCWRKSVAIEKAGLYIPAGSAPLFSTLLMLAIPAKIAGCKEIVVCTSPQDGAVRINPIIAYVCKFLGIDKVFAVGGAQAIAAMAYGTETVPKVNKIYGPGNQYVTAAKVLVNQSGIGIDMPAGPSEVLVIADDTANPAFVAADLLSQAEHGVDSQVMLLCKSQEFIDKTLACIDEQITRLDRQHFARLTLENSCALVFSNLSDAVSFSNEYAPEHLILATSNPHEISDFVVNAGSVFMGHYSPEAAGDYASGTNHTLPTNGYATSYSGVSLDSFCKKITFQELSKDGLRTISNAIVAMAEAEGLEAHKEAVKIRFR